MAYSQLFGILKLIEKSSCLLSEVNTQSRSADKLDIQTFQYNF